MTKLDEVELKAEVARLEGWRLEGGEIVREFVFPDFVRAIRFVDSAAVAAEEAGHHPDIDIRYNKVKMALVTHDAGGITTKDFALAHVLNGLAG